MSTIKQAHQRETFEAWAEEKNRAAIQTLYELDGHKAFTDKKVWRISAPGCETAGATVGWPSPGTAKIDAPDWRPLVPGAMYNLDALREIADAWQADDEDLADKLGKTLARSVKRRKGKKAAETYAIAPDGYRLTDVGNAERFVVVNNGQARWVSAWLRWVIYRSGCWVMDDGCSTAVKHQAKAVARYLFNLAESLPQNEVACWQEELNKQAVFLESVAGLNRVLDAAATIPALGIDHEKLDADPYLLNVANGVVDLRTGELHEHDPKYLCSIQAPVAYDPKAQAPRWERCLEQWQPDPAIREYLQREVGAGATGINTHLLSIHHGLGANGKSVFFGVIAAVLGEYTVIPHKSLLVQQRFEEHDTQKAKLFRKRLAMASETGVTSKLDEEQVKNLTGGDRLSARRMREDPWEFNPSHTLVIFTNHQPAIEGTDEGIWRRVRLVPWGVTIPEAERIDGLASQLVADEAPGILRWIVEGAQRFLAEGRKLTPPEAVKVATQTYRSGQDSVTQFVNECLVFKPKARTGTSLLTMAHARWCEDNGIDASAAHWRKVTKRFGAMPGVEAIKSNGQRYWRGVGLIGEKQADDEPPTYPASSDVEVDPDELG